MNLNDAVKNLQGVLNSGGASPKLEEDGIPGPLTIAELKKQSTLRVVPAPKPTSGTSADEPWTAWLKSHIGEKEQTGAPPTEFDKEVFSHTNYGSLRSVMEPGCAATLCAALEESGYKSPHNAAAESFRHYGTECNLKSGAICGMRWDGKASLPADHVTTCLYILPNGLQFAALGGNQSHEVKVAVYDIADIAFKRWPVK